MEFVGQLVAYVGNVRLKEIGNVMPAEIYTCVCGRIITGKDNFAKHRQHCKKVKEEYEGNR